MPNISAEIIEIRMEAGSRLSGRIWVTPPVRVEPGQYLLAQPQNECSVLPQALFVRGGDGSEIELAAPLPPSWPVGTRLSLRGPLGSGFHLPPGARKVALAALDGCPQRLLPLVQRTLKQGGDVALYCSKDLPDHLPLAVEVLPLTQLPQAPAWADYLALDVPLALLPDLPARMGLTQGQRCPCPAEALVQVPIPCGGMAACGVCAVRTTQGWRLACKDGPVFNLDILLER
jgi:dihydroorotate dehydrogenase electron transfer subunit